MSPEITTLVILAAAIVLFVTEWLRVDVVALLVVILLMLTDILTPSQAIAGFSSTAVITIAALFIVGGAVLHTGLASMIGERILKIAGDSETRLLIVIMLAVALLSGFMSDTGTVAVLLPAIVALARSAQIPPSKLLIPLSYGSLLGGAMTLIGTPPNIIVSDLLREEGMEPFNFFSYTPLGLILLVTGVIFMVLVGRNILPTYEPEKKSIQLETPEEILQRYRLPDNIYKLRVRSRSPLANTSLADSRLKQDYNLIVVEILRPHDPQRLMKIGSQEIVLQTERMAPIHPEGETVLQVNDVLLVETTDEDMRRAIEHWKLALQPISPKDTESLIGQEGGIAEVLIPPQSNLVNRTLEDLRFGSSNRLTVLNIKRAGTDENLALKNTRLATGDILLVQGLWRDILRLRDNVRDYVVLGRPEELINETRLGRAPLAAIVMAVMLVLIVFEVVPLVTAALIAAVAMVLTGCLNMDEAYDAIDWKSLVLIAGMLPMATALSEVGLVDDAAQALTDGLGDAGPLVVLGSLFLFTSVFTQVLSNTATAVLVAPIAFAAAETLDVRPQAFLMAVAVAASMAFASPVASPVNTLVMGAGNYRFVDYIKIGLPMIIIAFIVTIIFLPLIFPF